MKKKKDTCFVIIGAGPAGLTAAEHLKEKGYKNITLLEKEGEAGGKCKSVDYDGLSYELGAGIVSGNNYTLMHLVEKYNIPIKPVDFFSNNLYDLRKGGLIDESYTFPKKLSYFWQLLLRYYRLTRSYPEVQNPGFLHCEPELFQNFHQFAKNQGIPLVEQNFERFFTGFGYGYWKEIPAAYTLKYNDWPTLVSFIKRAIYVFPNGIQSLWVKMALQHDVKYNELIINIKREKNNVIIETKNQQYKADVLILTCPLDDTIHFMDVSETEVNLFSKIKYTDYRTIVCRLINFPNQTGFIPAHFEKSQKGHPVFWYKRYPDTDIYTFYVLSDFTVSDEIILKNLQTTITKLGGELKRIEQIIKWKYFPHVDETEMRDGFYNQMENIQGEKNTYYSGEIMNFSTVELSSAYSKNLIERFF
jgi:predicted NAD/FAD-dependent oxidoreductase